MFDSFKEAIRARVRPTSAHLASLRGDLRNRLRYFRSHRNAAEQTELAQDFVQVLRAWGIEDATQLPFVLRELCLRLLVFVLPVTVCALTALITQRAYVWAGPGLDSAPVPFGHRHHALAHIRAESATLPALHKLAVFSRRPCPETPVRRLP